MAWTPWLDDDLKRFLTSKEYANADPAMRKVIFQAYQKASPEERKAFIEGDDKTEGLTLQPDSTPLEAVTQIGKAAPKLLKRNLKDSAAMGIDVAGQVGGAAVAGAVNPALTPLGEMGGAVAADRLNRALKLRDPNKVDIPFAGQIENKRILGPITTGDVAAAAPTAIVRGIAGGAKLLTKPAQRAVQEADEVSTQNLENWRTEVNTNQMKTVKGIQAADTKAAAANVKNAAAYKKAVENETTTFKNAVAKINQDTSLSNQQQLQQYKDLHRNYNAALAEHRRAFQQIPAEGMAGVDPGDYKQAFADSRAAVGRAGDVDLAPLRTEAERLNIDLTKPLDPLNRTPMARITAALQEAGIEQPQQGSAYNAAFGGGATGGGPQPVSVDRLIATQQSLGRIVSTTEARGGPEHGAARKLYETVSSMLRKTAANNPDAAEAIEAHLEGQRSFRITESKKDFNELFQAGVAGNKLTRTGEIELNGSGIQTAFDKLVRTDRFFAGSFTPEQLDQMREALKKLPRKIGTEPPGQPPTPLTPDYTGLKQPRTVSRPDQVAPDYSKVDFPSRPPQPDPEKATMGPFPFGEFILTKILAQEGVARATGVQGSLPGVGLFASLTGLAVPHWVSKTILLHPKGEQMVRNIMAGERSITPAHLAGLTAAARAMGGQPEEDR